MANETYESLKELLGDDGLIEMFGDELPPHLEELTNDLAEELFTLTRMFNEIEQPKEEDDPFLIAEAISIIGRRIAEIREQGLAKR